MAFHDGTNKFSLTGINHPVHFGDFFKEIAFPGAVGLLTWGTATNPLSVLLSKQKHNWHFRWKIPEQRAHTVWFVTQGPSHQLSLRGVEPEAEGHSWVLNEYGSWGGAGERAQQLRVLAVLPGDEGQVVSTHTVRFTVDCNFTSKGCKAFLWLSKAHTCIKIKIILSVKLGAQKTAQRG